MASMEMLPLMCCSVGVRCRKQAMAPIWHSIRDAQLFYLTKCSPAEYHPRRRPLKTIKVCRCSCAKESWLKYSWPKQCLSSWRTVTRKFLTPVDNFLTSTLGTSLRSHACHLPTATRVPLLPFTIFRSERIVWIGIFDLELPLISLRSERIV